MDFKDQLLDYTHTQSATTWRMITNDELIQQTTASTFWRVWVLLLVAFSSAYAFASGFLPIPVTSTSMLIWAIAWLWVLRYASAKRQTLSYWTLVALLFAFALLEWYTLTGIFFVYEMGSIVSVFLTTWLIFMVLAVVGRYTTINIAKTWTFLMRALIAYIVAMLVNSFLLQNWTADLVISWIGLVIFAGLMIYDMNLIRAMAPLQDKRVPVLISLWLFLNFLNIFLILLRIFGWRD